jgi:hypothetical protein
VTLLLPVVEPPTSPCCCRWSSACERFRIRESCFVADRGMISADTIAAVEAESIEYMLGVRERTSRDLRAEIIEDGVAVPLVIPRQKGETELAIRETTIAGRRYVICRNEEQQAAVGICRDPGAGAEPLMSRWSVGDPGIAVARQGCTRDLAQDGELAQHGSAVSA